MGLIIEKGDTDEEIIGYTFHMKQLHFYNFGGFDGLNNLSLKEDSAPHWAVYLLKSMDSFNKRQSRIRENFGIFIFVDASSDENGKEILEFSNQICIDSGEDYYLLLK